MSTLQTPPLPTTCSQESHKQARAGAHTSQSPKAISHSLHIYAMEKAWATDPSAVTPWPVTDREKHIYNTSKEYNIGT